MMDYAKFLLITPKNDEESLMIGKIALAAGMPTLVSSQPHGARLNKEENLVERIRAVNPQAKDVYIVEIPGVETEAALRSAGFDVHVIDHHRYDALDRMQDESSLEQFLSVFDIDDVRLTELGFDPKIVRGVGMIDRGFLWALRSEVPDKDEQKRIRDFYRSLTMELGKDQAAIEQAAEEAWEKREKRGETIVVYSPRKDIGIRNAISFIVADNYDTPQQVVVIEGERRMFVQESDSVGKLFDTFGGFTFGRNRCWGLQATSEKSLPLLDDVLRVLEVR